LGLHPSRGDEREAVCEIDGRSSSNSNFISSGGNANAIAPPPPAIGAHRQVLQPIPERNNDVLDVLDARQRRASNSVANASSNASAEPEREPSAHALALAQAGNGKAVKTGNGIGKRSNSKSRSIDIDDLDARILAAYPQISRGAHLKMRMMEVKTRRTPLPRNAAAKGCAAAAPAAPGSDKCALDREHRYQERVKAPGELAYMPSPLRAHSYGASGVCRAAPAVAGLEALVHTSGPDSGSRSLLSSEEKASSGRVGVSVCVAA